ncbi:MAG: hypothetical protein Q9O74_03290 [Planctomycetota bacterium]|nr:hypothetical protein [Planctomycetota bacterium]
MRSSKRTADDEHSIGFAAPGMMQAREMFWQNVTREMLTSLAMQRARLVAHAEAHRKELIAQGKDDPGPIKDLPGFDGRIAVVTRHGDRIPITDIMPLFACSIGGNARTRALSEDVQCTVFQIRTPSGEVYTFPVHEIRGVHALSEEAMQSMKEEAEGKGGGEGGSPFGFAAFTSLSRELESKQREGEAAALDPEPG